MTIDSDQRFVIKGKDTDTVGSPVEEGFIVEAGSIARKETVPSLSVYNIQAREQLLADRVLEEHEGQLRFTRTHKTRPVELLPP